jgi:hypothetical protein
MDDTQITIKKIRFSLQEKLQNNIRVTSHKLKQQLIQAKIFEPKCYKCNNTTWNDRPINLELEHINGNKYDNRLENLTILCPNCHAQTSTYKSKNKNKPKAISPCLNEVNKVVYSLSYLRELAKNKTRQELADFLKVDRRTIDRMCLKHNIETQKPIIEYKIKNRPTKYKKISLDIPKEILEKEITEHSMLELSKKYGISDNGIRKRCKKLGIDLKKAKFAHKNKSIA